MRGGTTMMADHNFWYGGVGVPRTPMLKLVREEEEWNEIKFDLREREREE